ncbi:MAG TPA: 50S ribosomal protein L11 methyltransferase [Gaiellaceae bacterium]|jgi:ribosomal protein L11 methyltransferase|nr:50S ribosomal protein L11 methyltransferase [Gaiellaceae bacterium]
MLELFPQGFEEIDRSDGVELVAYTDPGGEERLWHAFGAATARDVPAGWEERWRDFHKPVQVAQLWIGPPWIEPPADAATVVIDPGRAFGTGAHPTTRLVLELLATLERGSVIDVGCGSGVLAIGASKLGFAPVFAVDVDENAIEATTSNARANGVELSVVRGDALSESLPTADVAVVNVTRGVAQSVAARLSCTSLVTSGYLLSEDVTLDGYRHVERISDQGWAADVYRREPG